MAMKDEPILNERGEEVDNLFVCAYCEKYGIDPDDLYGLADGEKYCLNCEDECPNIRDDADRGWYEFKEGN